MVRFLTHTRRPGLAVTVVVVVWIADGVWPAAVDAILAHPGAVVVTRDGDRFGLTD